MTPLRAQQFLAFMLGIVLPLLAIEIARPSIVSRYVPIHFFALIFLLLIPASRRES